MEPWYKVATPRKEVRQGRSFNPDEFAIALERVVAGTAPEDYRDAGQFFSRNVFTKALKDHTGMVLRRLCGKTENTAPVLSLVTQFGGGKTHTLAVLYHLARNGEQAKVFPGIPTLLKDAGLAAVPEAKVAVFVGNAWDPEVGRETPWIDVARQIAGDKGVAALGDSASTKPPGTTAIDRVFKAADGPVVLLFDEVLNFVNRHRDLADSFYAFLQNLTVATTGTTHGAAVISLPRSQVEMTPYDIEWQDRITKVVRRVAKDLIANDETEISEVVRRRLFENLGAEKEREKVSKAFAEWCFERRAQLPSEWTAVDTATSETKGRDFLKQRFLACYPFHPATLSVFQRKWQVLPQYQQTRGTLAMFAQWISWAYRDGYRQARNEPLITLGSAPLEVAEFRGVVLGQLGEGRLNTAIEADISGVQAHSRALDADSKGALRDIHRRVATVILFESSGGQVDKVAHLPELRFALCEPQVDTTSVDNAAFALEAKAYFIRKVASDGFQIRHQATLKKVVNDRKASLDEENDIKPEVRRLVKEEFGKKVSIPAVYFPEDNAAVQDSPKLTLVVCDPQTEWAGTGTVREQLADWTQQRSTSPRLYPASLIWCLRKPGRDLRDKVEMWLAWKRVQKELLEGSLGADFDKSEKAEVHAKVAGAEDAARDEVWGGYRFAVLLDAKEKDKLKAIDLGAGHSSGSESLSGRVIAALKSQGLLSEGVGAGYIERNWPPALKESGTWPLSSLRQSFLNGALTRLLDVDATLKTRLPEFVEKGDFGLASGQRADGTYDRLWYKERVGMEEIVFESGVFLLRREKAKALTEPQPGPETPRTPPDKEPDRTPGTDTGIGVDKPAADALGKATRTIRLTGTIPPELWNRLGTKIIPKLKSGSELSVGVDFSVTVDTAASGSLEADLRQILTDLGLKDKMRIE